MGAGQVCGPIGPKVQKSHFFRGSELGGRPGMRAQRPQSRRDGLCRGPLGWPLPGAAGTALPGAAGTALPGAAATEFNLERGIPEFNLERAVAVPR